MYGFVCLPVDSHTAKFPAIFRTKEAGSSTDTDVAERERTLENEFSRTRPDVGSFHGHMYNWKCESPKAPRLSCREMMPHTCRRTLGKFPRIDSTRGRKNGYSSTTSPVSVSSLQSRNSTHCICSKNQKSRYVEKDVVGASVKRQRVWPSPAKAVLGIMAGIKHAFGERWCEEFFIRVGRCVERFHREEIAMISREARRGRWYIRKFRPQLLQIQIQIQRGG